MKNKILAFLIAASGLCFAQNTVVATTKGVFLTAAPTGDCRVQFYNEALDQSTLNSWVCNLATGVWSTDGASNIVVAAGKTLTVCVGY